MMKPVKIRYQDEDWGNAQVDGFTFCRPDFVPGTYFTGFVPRRGAKAKSTAIILDDIKALRFMMEMKSIEWRHLTFEIDKILFQLVKYNEAIGNVLNDCQLTMINPA